MISITPTVKNDSHRYVNMNMKFKRLFIKARGWSENYQRKYEIGIPLKSEVWS